MTADQKSDDTCIISHVLLLQWRGGGDRVTEQILQKSQLLKFY